MKKPLNIIAAGILLFSCQQPEPTVLDHVNTFIGTGGHGHTYPGATTPFGMVQLSPDTRLEGWDGCGGYHYSDSVIYGFSHTHLSGTGIADYADILLMPTSGEVKLHNGVGSEDRGYSSLFTHDSEISSPGYYKVDLIDHNIQVELTATPRCGMHAYLWNTTEDQNLIIDLAHRDMVLESSIKRVSNNEFVGMRRSRSWAQDQVVYFVVRLDRQIIDFGIQKDGQLIEGDSAQGTNLKAFLKFNKKETVQLRVKVGISATSINDAIENLEAELDHFHFDRHADKANFLWLKELGPIQLKGGTEDQRAIFYSALYHSYLAPNLFSNVNGTFRGTDFKVHEGSSDHYTVFSLWDTFRATHPLFTILQTKRTRNFLETFQNQYDHGGQLPVWELSANYTGCMIGYHSIPVIADAYAKGITEFNTDKMLTAMLNSAEQDHLGLSSYKRLGFIPSGKESESASKTLEYAYDDWCIATFARKSGADSIAEHYFQRAQNYKNLYDPSTGFFRARANGGWFGPFDPAEVNFNYTEANAWQYSMFAPHDVNGHIDLMGGDEAYCQHLDDLFSAESNTTGREQADITGLIGQYAHGNEPSHHMAYLYSYAGKPWKTQELVRKIMAELYQNAPDGLSGNEDCGQMSSWFVLSALGFYPVTPGSDIYVIGSPLFEEAAIALEEGNNFKIKAFNNEVDNVYIKSAKLNGEELTRGYIKHAEIMNGGVLEFEMSSTPNMEWGSKKEDRPVSRIDAEPIVTAPFFVSSGRTFTEESMRVLLGSAQSDVRFMVRTSSTGFREMTDLILERTDTVWAYAVGPNGKKSKTVKGVFNKIEDGKSISIKNKYANEYTASGQNALIDKIRGGNDFKTGAWQGYRKDLEVVLDLGDEKAISRISVGFLQDIKSWIWMPREVRYFISPDGANFLELGSRSSAIPEDQYGGIVQEITIEFPETRTRFVKVVAEQFGICPEWHLGAGGKSWIFVDEVTVE